MLIDPKSIDMKVFVDILNAKQRVVFMLRDLYKLNTKAVSQIIGMPPATVRWYLHRARKKEEQYAKG